MGVRLEQVRDIYAGDAGREVCEDVIRKYLAVRVKIRNLGKAWKRRMPEAKERKTPAQPPASPSSSHLPFAVTDRSLPGEGAAPKAAPSAAGKRRAPLAPAPGNGLVARDPGRFDEKREPPI